MGGEGWGVRGEGWGVGGGGYLEASWLFFSFCTFIMSVELLYQRLVQLQSLKSYQTRQTVTLHADHHITCRLVLGPQVVSPQSTVHSIPYDIFSNAVGDMLTKLANGQTYLQFTQVLFLRLSLPLLLLLAILSLFQFKVRQATPLHPHHTLHLFKPVLKVCLVGSEDWKPLDTHTSYNSPGTAHCLGVRFYFHGCICMKGETPTHKETHRASSLPYSTST